MKILMILGTRVQFINIEIDKEKILEALKKITQFQSPITKLIGVIVNE